MYAKIKIHALIVNSNMTVYYVLRLFIVLNINNILELTVKVMW